MRSLLSASVAALLLLVLSRSAAAEGFDVAASAELSYDDNVFLLDEGQAEELDSGAPQNNDQLDDMESSADLIVGLGVRVDWSTKSIAGRTTRLRLEPGV